MSSRIQKIFKNKNKKLLTFTTGGDPDIKTSIKVIEIILNNGADIIEIGMPFSDPMADGPTIQLSSTRAIAKGVTLEDIFFICNQIREKNITTPIVLMGYYNLIYHYGINNFVKSPDLLERSTGASPPPCSHSAPMHTRSKLPAATLEAGVPLPTFQRVCRAM